MSIATESAGKFHYDPASLLDALIANLQLKNDAALSQTLEIGAPLLSKVRHRKLPVSGALLIRIHEVCGLDISDLRAVMGDRRGKFRVGANENTRGPRTRA